MMNIKSKNKLVMKTLASANRFKNNTQVKKSLASFGYLKRYTFLQKFIMKSAIFPIILRARSTVTDNSSISYNLSPEIIFPSF